MSNKKQTALQQAIAHYEDLSLKGSNHAYVVAKYLKTLLELEKQQIVDACGDEKTYLQDDGSWRTITAEQYYKETYGND